MFILILIETNLLIKTKSGKWSGIRLTSTSDTKIIFGLNYRDTSILYIIFNNRDLKIKLLTSLDIAFLVKYTKKINLYKFLLFFVELCNYIW